MLYKNNNARMGWYNNQNTFVETYINNKYLGAASVSIYSEDMDNDNDMDFVAVSSARVSWYENDGNNSFTEHIIAPWLTNASLLHILDMDGDNYMDVVSTISIFNEKIEWYRNNGASNPTFTKYLIDEVETYSIHSADLNEDGVSDLICANNSEVFWYEYNGINQAFTKHIISENAHSRVRADDIDNDFDMDIITVSDGGGIVWYENNGGQFYNENIISVNVDNTRFINTADMDGDGNIDILTASSDDTKIAWHKNSGNGQSFTEYVVTTNAEGSFSVYGVDMDNDSDLDILTASNSHSSITWYENIPTFQPPIDVSYHVNNGSIQQANNLIVDGNSVILNITGLDLGSNTVSITNITDATGCSASTELTSEIIVGIGANAISTPATCNGVDGSIELNVEGGVLPYSYDWSNGENTEDLTNLTTATYTVTVTDDYGCIATESAEITTTLPPVLFVETIDPICGGNNGNITIIVNDNGIAPFQYSIDNGITMQSDNVFPNLLGGVYDILITDAEGCETTNQVILSNELMPTIDTLLTIPPNCDNNDGSLTITASGGLGDYLYSINDIDFQTNNTFPNLTSGTYNVTLRDDNDCEASQEIILADASTVSMSSQTHSGCTNDGYNITVNGILYDEFNPSGQETLPNWLGCDSIITIDLSYSEIAAIVTPTQSICDDVLMIEASLESGNTGVWSSPSSVVFEDSNSPVTTVSNLTTDSNEIIWTVTNTNGHICTDVITIDYNPIASVGTQVTNANCGNSDGSLTVIPNGGTAPFTYDIGNGFPPQASPTFLNVLSAGTYTVTITDTNGCIGTVSATLMDEVAPTINEISTIDPSCDNDDGSITLTVIGGSLPYTYAWSNGMNSPSLDNVAAGDYSVTVTGANGCTHIKSADLTLPTPPDITGIDSQNALCELSDGSLTINASEGTGAYQYSIDNINFQSINTFTNLPADTYQVIVVDEENCRTTQSFNLERDNNLAISLNSEDPNCGMNDGIIETTPTEGTAPFSHQWSNGQTGFDAFDLPGGLHSVTVSDANGCVITADVTLIAPDPPVVNVGEGMELCDPSGTVLNTGHSDSVWSTEETGEEITVNAYGTYSVTVTDAACVVTDVIEIRDVIQFDAYPTIDTAIVGGEYVDFELSGADSYSWEPAIGLDCTTCANVRAQPNATTTYTITASIDGCEKEFMIRVGVGVEPSTLSPDGDGINDVLIFPGIENFPLNQFSVYNRWGTRVYHAQPYDNTWDGTYKGKRLPQGNYYYIMEFDAVNNVLSKQRLFITY